MIMHVADSNKVSNLKLSSPDDPFLGTNIPISTQDEVVWTTTDGALWSRRKDAVWTGITRSDDVTLLKTVNESGNEKRKTAHRQSVTAKPSVAAKRNRSRISSNGSIGNVTTDSVGRNFSTSVEKLISDDRLTVAVVNRTSDLVTSQTSQYGTDVTTDDFDDDDDLDDEDSDDLPTEQRLMNRLLRNYERSVRPVRNATDVVTVRMGMTMTQIFDMVSS